MPIQDGWYGFDNDLNSLIMALNGCYVVSGMTVTEQSPLAMGVTVAAGTYYANGQKVTKGSSTNVSLDASDPTNPRKDLIVGDSAGTISFVKGTATSAKPSTETGPKTYEPVPPNIPAGKTLLAEVWVGAGSNSITNANITDRRALANKMRDAGIRITTDFAVGSSTGGIQEAIDNLPS